MAKKLNFESEIQQNHTIQSWHVSQSVDAFTGVDDYDITISGSLTTTGSAVIQDGTLSVITADSANIILKRDDSPTGNARILTYGADDVQEAGIHFFNGETRFLINATTEVARVDSPSGYFGLNTDNPQQRLHVVGNQYIQGAITGSSDVFFTGLNNTVTPNIIGYDSTTGQLTYYNTSSVSPIPTIDRAVLMTEQDVTINGQTPFVWKEFDNTSANGSYIFGDTSQYRIDDFNVTNDVVVIRDDGIYQLDLSSRLDVITQNTTIKYILNLYDSIGGTLVNTITVDRAKTGSTPSGEYTVDSFFGTYLLAAGSVIEIIFQTNQNTILKSRTELQITKLS